MDNPDETPAELFAEHRHLVLEQVLVEPLRSIVHQYALKRVLHSPETSHGVLLRGTPVFYGDALAETMLELFEATVAELSGLDVDPSYSELVAYGRSAALNPVVAREAAEIRLTIHVGSGRDDDDEVGDEGEGEEAWPLLLETSDGTVEIKLAPGDALLHRPATDPVRREPLHSGHHVELQLNFVDRNGPHAQLGLDGRQELGAKPAVHQIEGHDRPRRDDDFLQEVFDDEVLLYRPSDGATCALNLTAALVWSQCDGESTADEIVERLAAAYPEQSAEISADVRTTITELRSLGVLAER